MAVDDNFDIESPDLRDLISRVRDFDPKMATALRREFRNAGAEIVEAQRDALGSGDTRDEIAAKLRTKISAGKTRQGIGITTGGPRKGGASLAKVFERKSFRHPVFGTGQWAEQAGYPFFNKAVRDGADRMRERIDASIDDVIRRIAQ
jgi:hypothetical protein